MSERNNGKDTSSGQSDEDSVNFEGEDTVRKNRESREDERTDLSQEQESESQEQEVEPQQDEADTTEGDTE